MSICCEPSSRLTYGSSSSAPARAPITADRATGDLDVWIEATPANAPRVVNALAAFGAPLHEVTEQDFAHPGVVFQIGVPPGRIDIVTELTGVTFGEAWPERDAGRFGDLTVDVIGRNAFVRNKRATGRAKDLGDIEGL